MDYKEKILIIFTASFPYGKKETYIDDELSVALKYYDKIFIHPLYYNSTGRQSRLEGMYDNVYVSKPAISDSKVLRIVQFIRAIVYNGIILSDIVELKRQLYSFSALFSFIKLLVDKAICDDYIKRGSVKVKDGDIYFYWGRGWANSIDLIKNSENRCIVRVHGGEIFKERYGGNVPYISNTLMKTDIVLCISETVRTYITTNYITKSLLLISRLGIDRKYALKDYSLLQSSKIQLISCSNTEPEKNIFAIINMLGRLNRDYHYTHIGDGSLQEDLITYIKNSGVSDRVTLKGRMNNIDVQKLYSKNHYHFFLNSSKHEGLPVSIMEAHAYGIPVIATNTGATCEIVENRVNGFLLEVDKFETQAALIINALNTEDWENLSRNSALTWSKKYSASTNYRDLYDNLNK